MSSRIRVEPVMFHPAGVMIYKAIYRRRVICLLRRDGAERAPSTERPISQPPKPTGVSI